MNKIVLRFTLVAFLFGWLPGARSAIRLAVVPESGAVRPAADMVTVALSAQNQVQLIERAELEKVLGEQAAAAGSRDYLKLGQILSADGVLLLATSGEGTNQTMNLRLMAVKSGVALRQLATPWPPTDKAAWGDELVKKFSPLWPKLVVRKQDAVPISILNLRAAVATTESELLERQLTTLLHDRLMQQPEVFVLERRRLELLAEEKEWTGETAEFWNGSYLVEGLINKDQSGKDVISLSAQMIPPDKQKVTTIEVTGQRTNVASLIDELSRRVLESIGKGSALPEWNPVEEAAQYWAEAQWAARWRMWREAQAASEASWALGRQTKDVAELRVRAWRETGLNRAGCTFEPLALQVSFSSPPDPERLGDLLRAADLFEAGWKSFVAAEPQLEAAWFDLGNALVGDISVWLRQYYFTPEVRVGQEERMAAAKQQADRICRLLAAHPGFANGDRPRSLAKTQALWGSLWVDTPEQGVKTYREILEAGQWPEVRGRFLNVGCFHQEGDTKTLSGWPEGFYDPASPLLVGWKWSDRQRWPQVWTQFVAELCAATNPLMAVEGRYLRCSFAWANDDYERELRELLEYAWQQRAAIVAAGREEKLVADLWLLAGKSQPSTTAANRLDALTSERRRRIKAELWPVLQTKFEPLVKEAQARTARLAEAEKVRQAGLAQAEQRQAWLIKTKSDFEAQRDFDLSSFAPIATQKYTQDEAVALLPALQDYRKRLSQRPSAEQNIENWTNWVLRFESKLEAAAKGSATNPVSTTGARSGLPTTMTNAPGSPQTPGRPTAGVRVPSGLPPGRTVGAASPAITATNYFRDIKFWRPDPSQLHSTAPIELVIPSVIFRDGILWAEVLFIDVDSQSYARKERCILCAIDPGSLTAEYIQMDSKQKLPTATFAKTGERHFEVLDGMVYFAGGDKVWRYSPNQKRWEVVPVPIEGPVRLDRVNDRLYLTSADSFMVLNQAGDGAEILASSRRRPAQSKLDTLDKLGSLVVFPGLTGAPSILLGGKIWSFSAASNDWEAVEDLPPRTLATVSEAGIIYREWSTPRPFDERELTGRFHGQADPELWFLLPPQQPRPAGFGMGMERPGSTAKKKARWQLPPDARGLDGPLCMELGRLWLFHGDLVVQSNQGRAVLKEENGRQGLLFDYVLERETPLAIPLRLELPPGLVEGATLQKLVGRGNYGSTLLVTTPAGLVLTHDRIPGFWLLARNELERQEREWLSQPPTDQASTQRAGASSPSTNPSQP